MSAHGSNLLFAQHSPLDIGAQLLAQNDASLLPGETFNRWAALGGDLPTLGAPLVDGARRDAQKAGQIGLTAEHGAGPQDRRRFGVHADTVAPLHAKCKAMLHTWIGSIASMTTHWTAEQEAKNLARLFKGVNQAAFAREHNVPGGASMVNQHIKGRRPINMDAALAYMKGFGCNLAGISPRLAEQMSKALRELDESKMASTAPAPAEQDPVSLALDMLGKLLANTPGDRREVIAELLAGFARDPSNQIYARTLAGLLDPHGIMGRGTGLRSTTPNSGDMPPNFGNEVASPLLGGIGEVKSKKSGPKK